MFQPPRSSFREYSTDTFFEQGQQNTCPGVNIRLKRSEQRVAIKFCFKVGLSATEKLVLEQKAYGKEDLNP